MTLRQRKSKRQLLKPWQRKVSLGNSLKSREFPFICMKISGIDLMKYTMRDVNRLIMARGWPRMMAMAYYITLAYASGDDVSQTLQDNYDRELVCLKLSQ